MAPTLGCDGCGLVFNSLGPTRLTCFKCVKREACGQDESALALVEKMKQCLDCGVVYKFFPDGRTKCGPCESGTKVEPAMKVKKDKENAEVKPSTSASDPSVISVDSDSDTVEISTMTALGMKVKQQKHVASGFRLTHKGVDPLPAKTRRFLDEREATRKRTGDPSKAATILFKTTILLQKEAGQKLGTRVPVQSRGFPLDDKMAHVLRKLVDMVNESDSPWAQQFPGRTFTRDDVQFTFKDGVGIPLKFTTEQATVSSFWNAHTQSHNQYFKKASIVSNIAEIVMLVPIEITLDVSSGEEDVFDEILNGRKRRPRVKESKKQKRVKLEDDDRYHIKDEPTEHKIPTHAARAALKALSRSSSTRPPVHLRLTCPIVFTKEKHLGTFSEPQISGELHGTSDVARRASEEMHTHFQLTHDGKHYLARRLEENRFQFSPDNELSAARAELVRSYKLKGLLDELVRKHGDDVPDLQTYSSPDLFIATVKERGTVLGHLVCQEKPAVPFEDIRKLKSPILDAISHYSLNDAKEEWVLNDFRVARNVDGSLSLFAPVSHSIGADSGLYDDGPAGLASFKTVHVCNEICLKFGLKGRVEAA